MSVQPSATGPRPAAVTRPGPWVRYTSYAFIVLWVVLLAATGRFLWSFFLVPAVGAILGAIIGAKVAKPGLRGMVPAFAVQGGQLLWVLVGMAVNPLALRSLAAVDIVILWVGLYAIISLRHWWPAAFLAAYHVFGLVVNFAQMASSSVATPIRQAALASSALRVTALFLMAAGLIEYLIAAKGSALAALGGATAVPADAPAPAPAAEGQASPAPPAQPEQRAEMSAKAADELRLLAKLAQEGVLTQEEFEAKKKLILGL